MSAVETGLPLQEWMNEVLIPADDLLIWKRAGIEQAIFVRDALHPLFAQGEDANKRYEWVEEHPVRVVSTHRSKSIDLPVYRIQVPGLTLTMRDNFYNWVVSVDAAEAVKDVFYDLISRSDYVHPVYCEGFRDEWVFGPYDNSARQFTASLPNQLYLWTFCYLLKQETKQMVQKWTTILWCRSQGREDDGSLGS